MDDKIKNEIRLEVLRNALEELQGEMLGLQILKEEVLEAILKLRRKSGL